MNSRLSKVGMTVVLGFGLALTAQSAASAAGSQTAAAEVSVDPSTNLAATASVTVSGSSLLPGTVYYALQCGVVSSSGEWACDAGTRVEVTSTAGGTFSVPLTVHKTFEGVRGDGSTVSVDCGTVDCLIGVATPNGSDGGQAAISFA